MPSVEELACLNCTLTDPKCDGRDVGCYFYKAPPVKPEVKRRKYFAIRYTTKQRDERMAARLAAKGNAAGCRA